MLWLLPLKRYFQFSGRASRAEFWQFFATVLIVCAVAFAIDANSTNQNQTGIPTIMLIAVVVLAVPFAAVFCRRLHDKNMSGRLAGGIIGLWLAAIVAGRLDAELQPSVLHAPFGLLAVLCHLGSLALLGYLLNEARAPGDPGDNPYGPPPPEAADHATVVGESGLAVSQQPGTSLRSPGSASSPRRSDPLDQLERLAALHRDGLLTDDEFARQKAVLLER